MNAGPGFRPGGKSHPVHAADQRRPGDRSNRYLLLGIGAVVIPQLIFTHAPPLQATFGTEAIPLRVWLLLSGLAFFLVVEAEKLVIRSSPSLRRAVAEVEAG